jgi:hypothetical protein
VRQGCPLAPLIFNLAVDGLVRYACKLSEAGIIRGYSISSRRAMVPILQYTDDTVFFVEGTRAEAQALCYMVKIFGDISGLKLNGEKSSLVCFGLSDQEQGALSEILGTPHTNLPIRYLGLPLRCLKLRKSDWNFLFDKISIKLEGWNSRFLSKGGRLILLNSIITSIPVFYFSLFKAPKSIWKCIDLMRKRFFWKGVRHEGRFM